MATGDIPSPDQIPVYKTIGETELRMHVFLPGDWQASDMRPALVFFFGGGWVGGNPSQFYPHCRHLANLGLVAIGAEYRIQSLHGTTPFEAVTDGKSAIRWLRANAAEWGVDPDRIASGGGSAGGHVAACTGVLPGLDDPADDLAVSCRPSAMVLFNPVVDNSEAGYGAERLGERWQEISPLHAVKDQAPPAILFLGDQDNHVPVSTLEKFRDKIQAAGAHAELHVYEGQPHGFFNYGRSENRYYNETVAAMDKFLARLGYLKPTFQISF
jgi:acetyl esterase/lipase